MRRKNTPTIPNEDLAHARALAAAASDASTGEIKSPGDWIWHAKGLLTQLAQLMPTLVDDVESMRETDEPTPRGYEAEELRRGLEKLADETWDGEMESLGKDYPKAIRDLLDQVDARDSLAVVEESAQLKKERDRFRDELGKACLELESAKQLLIEKVGESRVEVFAIEKDRNNLRHLLDVMEPQFAAMCALTAVARDGTPSQMAEAIKVYRDWYNSHSHMDLVPDKAPEPSSEEAST